MLGVVASNGNEDIVSWQPHGKAFRVHKPQDFAKLIMPHYFKQSQYKSFQRQLNIYGFNRINKKGTRDMGAYYHEEFIRGEKNQSLKIVRQEIKGRCYNPRNNHIDPDFYAPKLYKHQGLPRMSSTSGGWPDCTRLAICSPPPIDEGIISKPYYTDEETEQSSNLDSVNESSQRILSSNHPKECYFYGDHIQPSCSFQSISGCFQDGTISLPHTPSELFEGDELFFEGRIFFFVDTKE
jgi:hypothetical protein